MTDPRPTEGPTPDPVDELAGPPRWVKVVVVIAAVLILLFLVLKIAGKGEGHGPGRHGQPTSDRVHLTAGGAGGGL